MVSNPNQDRLISPYYTHHANSDGPYPYLPTGEWLCLKCLKVVRYNNQRCLDCGCKKGDKCP